MVERVLYFLEVLVVDGHEMRAAERFSCDQKCGIIVAAKKYFM